MMTYVRTAEMKEGRRYRSREVVGTFFVEDGHYYHQTVMGVTVPINPDPNALWIEWM